MPSAPVRFALEAAFLVLVALGAGLARLDPLVIIVLMAVAWVLVALVERASARDARRAAAQAAEADQGAAPEPEPRRRVDVAAEEPAVASEPEIAPDLEPELAVSERSARAILASGPPPVPEQSRREPEPQAAESPPEPEPASEAEPARKPEPEPEPEPEPAPEPEYEAPAERRRQPIASGAPREWNLWYLERLVRERPDNGRDDELAAILLSLRDFASIDGTLPVEFDELVRESFGPLIASADEETEAAAAP